ncbi:hypothetical protein SAMN02745135_01660 [Caloranaerobacter azorensis DSM 13643]|uniref:Uncharacterized protein n=1 Tax=Caloranaerobacter azorensis DSM 13643 TaxID=1121264 RepID=A0A1M5UZX5_9FIRM|nr:hypothetical protein [Caloranaerobacter azorensis]SHH68408.1 hypothetical protein SAMN02745135_01660 [Caloranaerobacter azorensis DSM 13643]
MTTINKDVLNILSTGVFKKILDCDVIEIAQLNAAIALLIKANIDFDVSFTSGTRRSSPTATLTIYINPTARIRFSFVFDSNIINVF